MNIIKETSELAEFCSSLEKEEFISIDTEFIREKTYFPKACLIQIASQNDVGLIDPQNLELDLLPLNKILQNESIVKVFHSGKQDLEIIYRLYKELPKNFFDTQIAASFCGYGISVSYENIVKEMLNIKLDKTYCISDWSLRPLLKEQLSYAAADVLHLREVYLNLHQELQNINRLPWALEDINFLNNTNSIFADTKTAWKKIKDFNKNHEYKLIIKKLATWREEKAQLLDLPRNKILDEKLLLNIAESLPLTTKEISVIYKDFISVEFMNEIILIVKQTMQEQLQESYILNTKEHMNFKGKAKLISKIRSTLNKVAEEINLPPALIASSSDIKSLTNNNFNVRLMKGWRYEIVGKDIEKLLQR